MLDPEHIVVNTGNAGALTWSNYWQAQIISSTASPYRISPTTIVNALKTNNVVLEASNSLTVDAEINWFTGVSATNSRSLTLIAGAGGVTINQDILASNYGGIIIGTNDNGNVVINASIVGNFIDIESLGSIKMNAPVEGNVTVSAFLSFNNYATLTAMRDITSGDQFTIYGMPTFFAPSKTYEGNFKAISQNGSVSIQRLIQADYSAKVNTVYPANLGTVTIEAKRGSVKIGELFTQKLSGFSRDGWSANFAQTYDSSSNRTYSTVTLGEITNTGAGGIKITSVNEISFNGNLSGGNGSVADNDK